MFFDLARASSLVGTITSVFFYLNEKLASLPRMISWSQRLGEGFKGGGADFQLLLGQQVRFVYLCYFSQI